MENPIKVDSITKYDKLSFILFFDINNYVIATLTSILHKPFRHKRQKYSHVEFLQPQLQVHV